MAQRRHCIVGIHISDRVSEVPKVQQILTQYGCYIRTRLGLHDVEGDYCSPGGLLLLDMVCDEAAVEEMKGKLNTIEGVEVQEMLFGHEPRK